MKARWGILPLVGLFVAGTALADPREEYHRRNAERLLELFRMADFDRDGVVSREEATGAVELQARFDDIDVGRDGSISLDELQRWIDATFR